MIATFKRFWQNSRALRWSTAAGVMLLSAIALAMIYLLTQATTNNSAVYERNYQRLLVANLVVVAVLLAVLFWLAWHIWRRFRKGKFGSRLLLKLALVFVLVASVPGALLYLVSYQFVTRSIESWFDVKVETALNAGLSLGRSVLDTLTADASGKTRALAQEMGNQAVFDMGLTLERLRSQQNADRLIIWSQSGAQIASSSVTRFLPAGKPPTADVVETLKTQTVVAFIDGLDDALDPQTGSTSGSGSTGNTGSSASSDNTGNGAAAKPATSARIVVYSLVRTAQFGLQDQAWVLQLEQSIPPELLQNAVLVQEANREYQERALARLGLQRMFIGTLTLTLFLAVFGAVLLASLLAAQLARPLLYLAEGVRQVAAGDLSPKNIDTAQDELGGLTRSFAQMTQQLADTRQALTSSMTELDASRSELQTILDNLTSGVLVLQADGTILSANPGASRILGQPQSQLQGQVLAQISGLEHMADLVQQQFESLQEPDRPPTPAACPSAPSGNAADASPIQNHAGHSNYWQHSMELNPPAHEGLQQDAMTLVLRGALLPESATPDMRLLVFEDISAIVSAQRAQAWGDVARRLAHEIKNPLTPIQLSAERLEMKLGGSLPAEQQAILSKSVRTIVEQVEAMKRLVNEFRDYARLPAAHLLPVDLNALITSILQLYESDNAVVPIAAELDPDCQPVLADAEQLRQIIHNLLQNAQDAQEQAGRGQQAVHIQTQWRPATQRVRLSVSDSGAGFPEHILQRAFEPYVTTKTKGTGLGLAVVKKIADEHSARISISNRVQDGEVLGAQVSILLATQQQDGSFATGT